MFEREEEKLKKHSEQYEEISIPEVKIDEAILAGLKKAKDSSLPVEINNPNLEDTNDKTSNRIEKKRKWLVSGMAAAILIIGFLTSIRVSPAFAYYVASIPGMEKLVELISDNKGLMAAVENDYLQPIDQTQEKNNIKLILESALVDETGLVIFYSVETKTKQEKFDVDLGELTSTDGTALEISSISGSRGPWVEPSKSFSSSQEFTFQNHIETKDFHIKLSVKTNVGEEEFDFDFSLTKPIQKKKTYELNKVITIEGQKITVKKVDIYPLRAAVHVKIDPDNTKEIFAFEDIRLVDENSESWTKTANGLVARMVNEQEQILYLQSNYFNQPEELYLVLNKLQAVDKDEAYVIVDPKENKILKQPKGDLLQLIDYEMYNTSGDLITFRMKGQANFHYSPFLAVTDQKGREVETIAHFDSGEQNGDKITGIELRSLEGENYQFPLKLELSAFPSWIKGDVKMRIK